MESRFMERALFYSSFAIQEQVLRGQDSYGFMPVYFIALMDFELHPAGDGRFVYRYNLLDVKDRRDLRALVRIGGNS